MRRSKGELGSLVRDAGLWSPRRVLSVFAVRLRTSKFSYSIFSDPNLTISETWETLDFLAGITTRRSVSLSTSQP